MATPTAEAHSTNRKPAEAAGDYRQPEKSHKSSWGWILGLLAALILLGVILWIAGVFGDDDDGTQIQGADGPVGIVAPLHDVQPVEA